MFKLPRAVRPSFRGEADLRGGAAEFGQNRAKREEERRKNKKKKKEREKEREKKHGITKQSSRIGWFNILSRVGEDYARDPSLFVSEFETD